MSFMLKSLFMCYYNIISLLNKKDRIYQVMKVMKCGNRNAIYIITAS